VQQRQLVLRRPCQRHRVPAGVALAEPPGQRRTGQHLPGENLARRPGQLGQIDAGGLLRERRQPDPSHPLLDQRAQPRVVRAGGDVLGAAQQAAAHDPAVVQRVGQVLVPEAGNAGPQPHVRRVDLLRLHGDEVSDDLVDGSRIGSQQELALEVGAVELAQGDGHGSTVPIEAVSS
jgi:hypothetical protein